ncbi:transposase [Acinetobacter baumannii]|nr:transposase [Acinetobacter baumannii]
MVRGSGIRDIAEVERISIGKVLRTLTESTYEIQPQQSHYESLEVDEFWNFVGNKRINNGLFTPIIEKQVKLLLMFWGKQI